MRPQAGSSASTPAKRHKQKQANALIRGPAGTNLPWATGRNPPPARSLSMKLLTVVALLGSLVIAVETVDSRSPASGSQRISLISPPTAPDFSGFSHATRNTEPRIPDEALT